MKDEGVHILFPKTAIKQQGRRVVDVERDYDLPIHHIRTTMSEKTSSKYIKAQNLGKQMLSTLSNFSPIIQILKL